MATAKSSEDKKFWREFIAMYRNLPALWQVKSDEYKNRNNKDRAYDKMVEKMKEINPKADRDAVRTKINALRTSYRREIKKIKDSTADGKGRDDVYQPNLWYFNNIDFLRDQEAPMPGTSSMDHTENHDGKNDTVKASQATVSDPGYVHVPKLWYYDHLSFLQDQDNSRVSNTQTATMDESTYDEDELEETPRSIKKMKRRLTESPETTFMDEYSKVPKIEEDESSVFGRFVATKHFKLSPVQRMYAESLIILVLNKGLLGQLSESTTIRSASPEHPS